MSTDPHPIRAFLEPSHEALLGRAQTFGREVLSRRKPPATDVEGRTEARALLKLMGDASLFEPIQRQDYRGCCLLREELAFHSPLADAVFALQALGATPLLLRGSPLQVALATEAIAGHRMGAFAMTEPEAGSDAHAMSCEARREGDGYILNGVKTLISNGGLADFYVVFAQVAKAKPKGITAFLVETGAPGLEFVKPLIMSAPHPLGEVAFRDCRVSESARLGEEGEGLKIALSTLDRLRATVGAAACGMGARALAEAIRHAQTRRQFGKPLADLPLIQDKIARMAIRLRAARLLVYEAAWEKDRGAERVTVESGMAKAFATENAQTIVDDAVQILGGRGVLQESMVDLLNIGAGSRVLEVGCGTGRDSFRIARRLDAAAALHVQDLSAGMVSRAVVRLGARTDVVCALSYSVSSATALPFATGEFDAVFHFGGFNLFGDLKAAAVELARVVRPGGRVVFGDEGVAPWLRGTEFAGIVTTNNPLFAAEVPLAALPDCAADVSVRWVIGNCFYLISFTKADSVPALNLDLPHQGWRGGSLRSRYFGRLEGVSDEAKAQAIAAAKREGISVSEWLDRDARRAAEPR
ncbi:MAG: acyl-CoA dehydrogenase family protein [Vicinamibacteria bacterium]